MRKSHFILSGLLMGALALSGCDDSSSHPKLTAEQQIRLAEIKSQERIEMARISKEAHQRNLQTQQANPYYEDREVYLDNSNRPVADDVSDDGGNGVGTHVLAAGAGAVGGYLAGKAMSKPDNQRKVSQYKRKAYTQYRFAKSKASSKYRSLKKRK